MKHAGLIIENMAKHTKFHLIKNYFYVEKNFDKHVTPHTLRHTAATLMLENHVSIKKVQKHLRHSSIQTTARYLHILDNKEAASDAILGGI